MKSDISRPDPLLLFMFFWPDGDIVPKARRRKQKRKKSP